MSKAAKWIAAASAASIVVPFIITVDDQPGGHVQVRLFRRLKIYDSKRREERLDRRAAKLRDSP